VYADSLQNMAECFPEKSR